MRKSSRDLNRKSMNTILNFSSLFVHFLESSDRLSSPKLLVKNSSSSPSSTSSPPAASSQPSVHVIDMSNSTLSTSESPLEKTHHELPKNLKQQPPPPPTSNEVSTAQIKLVDDDTHKSEPDRRRRKSKQSDTTNHLLSDDAKQRAQILLEMLTKGIETRSKKLNDDHQTHPHSSYFGVEHYKDDPIVSQQSPIHSPDPYTNKLPPKVQRHSASLNKTPTQTDAS